MHRNIKSVVNIYIKIIISCICFPYLLFLLSYLFTHLLVACVSSLFYYYYYYYFKIDFSFFPLSLNKIFLFLFFFMTLNGGSGRFLLKLFIYLFLFLLFLVWWMPFLKEKEMKCSWTSIFSNNIFLNLKNI